MPSLRAQSKRNLTTLTTTFKACRLRTNAKYCFLVKKSRRKFQSIAKFLPPPRISATILLFRCSDSLMTLFCLYFSKSVLISCWGYHPERRPTVDDLMDIMLNSECLIMPCLNAPKTAVALEMQESLDIVPLRQGHRSRTGLRTPSEHNQVSSVSSARDSKIFTHSPTGVSEPFIFPPIGSSALPPGSGGNGITMVGNGGVAPLVMLDHRSRISSENQQSEEGRTETMSGSPSGSEPDITTHCLPKSHNCEDNSSSKSTSPDSPLQLRYIALPASLEERADSDYSSEHSKDIWNLNGTSVV